ncbi:MAG: 3-hydroxyacyl-[acyl-carrier-protein] dehydratase FabZ [bacterium]|jgi:3-hydroxyacyl-[acyl-carrier-protein] dehydratase
MTHDGSFPRLLPHRYPFLLVDRVIELEPGKEILALKRVSAGEEFAGQIGPPGLFPLSLIAEAMAQAASIVAASASQEKVPPSGFYAAIKGMRIVREPEVGEELWLRMKLLHQFGRFFEFQGEARIGGEVVGEGQLVFQLP